MNYLAAFGRFWWDFIVGDSLGLAIGAPLALFAGYGLHRTLGDGSAEFVLPGVVAATLALTLIAVNRRTRRRF